MKKRILFLTCAIVLVAMSRMYAQGGITVSHDYEGPPHIIGNTIIQTVQACGPVTIEAAEIDVTGNPGRYKNYTVASGTTWNKLYKIRGGYDCKGTNLKVSLRKEREEKRYPNGIKHNGQTLYFVIYVTYYYTLSTGSGSHNSSSSSNNSYSSNKSTPARSSSSSSSYTSNNDYSKAAELGSAWARASSATKVYDYYDNYRAGGFSLAATVSAAWGENIECRFRYGSSMFGGDITGMVGYDWINGHEGDELTWNVGMGMYFGGRPTDIYLWDVDFGLKFGKSNIPFNNAWTMMIDLNTTHLIGPEHVIGLIAGAGIGLGGHNPDFAWDVRGGIVIYFLQWNWF